MLTHQIATGLHRRVGAAPSNFAARLPSADSELAQQLTRDPYVLDFLDLARPVNERDLQAALLGRVQQFLLELESGFAFVGSSAAGGASSVAGIIACSSRTAEHPDRGRPTPPARPVA